STLPAGPTRSLGCERAPRLPASRRWPPDVEARANARSRVDLHLSPVALHDLLDDGQPQAGPPLLGGEERLEDARPPLLLHSPAAVLHRQPDPAPRACPLAGASGLLGPRTDPGRAHPELTAPGHGVAGVQTQVHQDLLELGLVSQDTQVVLGQVGLEA